jgi:SAM-dependent methyltransferase
LPEKREVLDYYAAHYREFGVDVQADVRREAFGEDVGQNSWLTADELRRFASWLQLRPSARLLDVACGSGGPALQLAELTGCDIVGVELDAQTVENAIGNAQERGLAPRAAFVQSDATLPLSFDDGSFDALLCVDAINHLPDRAGVLRDWARVLRPGGRLLFTDPVVVTGTLNSDELATRTSIGYFLFVPAGENERLLADTGLTVCAVEDTTASLAEVARRRGAARAAHADALRRLEGEVTFDGLQRFFETVAVLARERRLSRFVYVAERDQRE